MLYYTICIYYQFVFMDANERLNVLFIKSRFIVYLRFKETFKAVNFDRLINFAHKLFFKKLLIKGPYSHRSSCIILWMNE